MTDPTGLSFTSYRRARLHEAKLLVEAQRDHGIPTWQDIDDLRPEPTELELERVLADPTTANVVLWVTEEVAGSAIIRKVEVPAMKKRKDADDGFFILPVAAGGLDYNRSAEIVSSHIGLNDFRSWNFEKTTEDPISEAGAVRLAEAVLARRLTAIDGRDDRPFRLGLWTRSPAPKHSGLDLQLDWKRHFDGRIAAGSVWRERLVPSLGRIVSAICAQNPRRGVVAEGQVSLVAALALGVAFLEPCGVHLAWRQQLRGTGTKADWSLRSPSEPSGLSATLVRGAADAVDIGVAVSLRADVEPAIKRGQEDGTIPAFRGSVVVTGDGGSRLETPGQTVDAVERTIEAIREAQAKWPDPGKLHLFLAAPAGFAVMLGQRLNGLGPAQTYEHDPRADRIGHYRAAVLLTPGS